MLLLSSYPVRCIPTDPVIYYHNCLHNFTAPIGPFGPIGSVDFTFYVLGYRSRYRGIEEYMHLWIRSLKLRTQFSMRSEVGLCATTTAYRGQIEEPLYISADEGQSEWVTSNTHTITSMLNEQVYWLILCLMASQIMFSFSFGL